jgi:sugar lactone lactonase YvrE
MYNDSQGNVFIADEGLHAIRVVYKSGTALAAALVAATPGVTLTPTSGNIYGLGAATTGTPTLFTVGAACGSATAAKALDTVGDGCPAQYADMHPLAIVVDQSDNIFFGDANYPSSGSSVHVVYVGGTAVANLIKAYNPLVTTPQVGYVYALSFTGGTNTTGTTSDFVNVYSIAVDSNDNLYASDNGAIVTSVTGILATTDGLQIKKFVSTPVAGWATFVQGGNGAVLGQANGDGGPYTAAKIASSTGGFLGVQCDPSGNLYIGDGTQDVIRVVYLAAGSLTPPLYVNGTGSPSASTIVAPPTVTPVVGNIYSVSGGLGGGSYRHTGIAASLWANDYLNMMGLDQAGNLLTIIDGQLEKTSIATGIQTLIGGVLTSTTTDTLNPAPAAGATCSGLATGPTMTNAYGSGCPAMTVEQVNTICCVINADSQGNFYVGDYRSGTSVAVVEKYTYQSELGSVSSGNSTPQPIAFVPSTSTYLASGGFHAGVTYGPPNPTIAVTSEGQTSSEFVDTGATSTNPATADTCFIWMSSGVNYENCMYYVTLTPAKAGPRIGSATVTNPGTTPTVLDTVNLGGVGLAAQLSIDPGAQSTLGTALAPAGAALDQFGNIYISSGTTAGALYKSTAGAFPTSFVTGFSSPKEVAIDGYGNIYVADSGNNQIAIVAPAVAPAPPVSASYLKTFTPTAGPGSTSLSSPSGVAVDVFGNIYVSDTGNNRVVKVGFAGNISILPFSGLSAPGQLAVDAAGDVYVVDTGNKRVVELNAAGVQSTVTVTPALASPVGVALDPAGDLYIADAGNQNVVMLLPGSSTATALLSSLTGLNGVLVDQDGDVFAESTGAGGLVVDNRTNTTFTYPTATPTGYTATEAFTLTDAGTAQLTIGASLGSNSDTADWLLAPGSTNGCNVNGNISPGAQCTLAAEFKPATNAGKITDTVTFPTYNTAAEGASIGLVGNTVFAQSTTTTITAAANPIAYGTGTTLTITVVPNAGTLAATGQVTLTMNGVAVAGSPFTLTPASSGLSATATFTVPIMVAGSYSFIATYQGVYGLSPSTSAAYILVVNPAPASKTTVTASSNPVAYGSSTTLTIQVAPVTGTGVPQGQVTLTQNNVPVTGSPFTLSSTGTVTYTASGLNPGNGVTASYTFAATYQGTYSYAPSTGNVVVVVNPPPADFTLSLASTTGTVNYHNSIVNTLTITPVQYSGYNLVTNLTCTGVPSSGECLVVPTSVTPNGTAPVTAIVTLSTGALVTSLRNSPGNIALASCLFGILGVFGLRTRRGRHWPRLLAALLVFTLLTAIGGCSSSSIGTYTLTITGTGSGGQTHNATWTVTVQY